MPIKLTDKLITAHTGSRRKVFDSDCKDFYVDVLRAGHASFWLKVWSPALGKQQPVRLGAYNPETFTTEIARAAAFKAKGQGGDVIAKAKAAQAVVVAHGVTFNQVADDYIAYCAKPIPKHGKLLPRYKRWVDLESLLKTSRAAFGDTAITEVAARDILKVLTAYNDAHKIRTANRVRTTLFGLFRWAAEAGRELVAHNPCTILPRREKTKDKDRYLRADEIRALWWGLEQADVPCQRTTAIALKLILATGLRPDEVLSARWNEIGKISKEEGGDGKIAYHIPADRTKKGRDHVQPLNTLAQELVAELRTLTGDNEFLFPSKAGKTTLTTVLSDALAGKTHRRADGTVKRYPNILEHLGFTKEASGQLGGRPFSRFSPHVLRHTVATQLGLHDVSKIESGRILDHDVTEPGEAGATKIYDVSTQVRKTKLRRPTLDRWDDLLRDIIGKAPATNVVRLKAA